MDTTQQQLRADTEGQGDHMAAKKTRATKAETADKYVVVCTEKRGVFAGFTSDPHAEPITLRDARMCVYWSADVRGVVGLAATGPTAGCRVTQPAPESILRGVTAVFAATPGARDAWVGAPWSS